MSELEFHISLVPAARRPQVNGAASDTARRTRTTAVLSTVTTIEVRPEPTRPEPTGQQVTGRELTWRMHPSKLSVVFAVVRRLVPYLIEATLIPSVLFYAFLVTFGLLSGFLAALGWEIGRASCRERVL